MTSSIRRNIKTDVSKNRSLKDILSPTASALEIISVQPLTYNIHNTETIAIIEEDGVIEKRSLVYNRLNVNLLLQSVSIVGNTINEIIDNLNDLDFDFTTDDLDLVNGMLITKPTSLGYYGAPILVGEILPEANVDTMMLLEQPAWLEPLYDIVINDELFSMSNVLLLDTSTHAMFDREASAKKSPVSIDVGFPPGLKDLLDIFQQPESTGVLFRNRTNQELHVKLIPRNANMFSNYDHLNEAVFYDADGYLNFILAPKQTYNKATDDLVVIWGFNPESNLTSEYPMMIGINPSYFYMVSPGDYVEIETTLTPSSGNGFSQTGTNPDTGAGIWRFELFSDLDPYINDPAITGIRYIWMEFDGVIGLEPSEVRVRSNKPIHQMELWNIIEVVNWGKYVVDQPYEVGDDVAASPMKSVLTKVGETSYTVPGALLNPYGFFKHENHPTPTFNVYEYVKRAGTGMEDLYIDVPQVVGTNFKPRETQISDWFLNKPTLISNATPIFNDTSNPKYETSSISVPLKTLEVRLKAEVNGGSELKTLAALFPAEQSRFIKKDWVGSLGLPSKDFLTYQFDSVNNEDVYTIDVAGFIASGNYGPSTPYTQNDLRLLLKARWSSTGTGKVLMKVKGISPADAVVHQWQDVVETNIFGSQPNIWRDFIIFSESLHIGGLVPHPLHLALLGGVYRYPTGYKTENWIWGYSGQMVRNFDEDPFPRPFIPQTFEGATNKVYIEPKLNSTDYILDRNGTVSINDGKALNFPSTQWCEPVRPKNVIGTSVDLVQSPNSMFTKQEKINLLNPNAEYSDVYFLLDEGSEIQNAIDIANALRKSSTTLVFEKDGVGQAFNNGFDTTPFLKDAVEGLVTQLGTTTNIVDLDFSHTVVYDKFNVPFSASATGIGNDFLKLLKQLTPDKSFEFTQLHLTLFASAWTLDNVMVNNVLKTSQTVFNIYFSFRQVFRQNLPTVPYDSYAFYNDSTREYSFFNNFDPGTIPGQTKYSMMPVYPNNIRTISSIEGDASVLESRMAIEFAMPDNSTKIYTVGNEPSNLLAEPYVPFLKKSGNQVGTLFEYYLFYRVISSL